MTLLVVNYLIYYFEKKNEVIHWMYLNENSILTGPETKNLKSIYIPGEPYILRLISKPHNLRSICSV